MDTIIELIPYVALGLVCYRIGKFVALIEYTRNCMQHPDLMIKTLERIKDLNQEEADQSDRTEMSIEREGDQLYAYDKATGQFLGQGPSLAALTQVVSDRFPDKIFFGTISRDDPAKELVK